MRSTKLAFALAAALLTIGTRAGAEQSLIKHPGDHPSYIFEAEPHGLVGFGPFGHDHALGAGFRGTVTLVRNGFISRINNSVGLGFGADFFFGKDPVILIPVVMQWNFWVSTHWSVFGEPGIGFATGDRKDRKVELLHPILSAGARFHFSERVALTLRAGYPSLSVGVSFLL
jgi:hypothetical protein